MNDYSPIVTTDGRKLCGIKSCGRAHRVRGLCLAHGQRVRVHGDPQVDKPLRSHSSRPWKGAEVSYIGAHNRVTREHGKAVEWKCACGCGRQAADWAYLGTDPAAKVDESGRLYRSSVCVSSRQSAFRSVHNLVRPASLRFVFQVTGAELATEPPTPDTPLARILRYVDEHGYESLTDEHFDMVKLGLL
ncbi:hypothetical protein ACFYWN_00390 [Streptomyces sp. NPDC002917]|uniref:hypothetical protein n=1 Tax=Streptomyces sp. NPDC002917 TaxID=3364671 RepID=UPI0036AC1983